MKIIDMHCDTISRIYQERLQNKEVHLRKNSFQVDLLKMKASHYLLQNFALFIDLGESSRPYETFCSQLALFQEEMEKNSDIIAPVTSYSDLIEQQRQGKMFALLTLEEGEACCGSLDRLEEFYKMGIRMMTFTWNFQNSLGAPSEPAPFFLLKYPKLTNQHIPQGQGLTPLGMEFLEKMESLGIIPDVSHLSDQGIRDVCRLAKKPFCASHSNARALCSRKRNLPDELIHCIAEHGGIIGANYYGPFLSDIPDLHGRYFSQVADIAKHIRHMADVGGISCVGLGSDFDGIDANLELENCSKMELLAQELKKYKFHESEIDQIFHKNVLNFYRELL